MLEPEIIYEDGNFAAVNKPAGLLVHATPAKGKAQSAHKEETLVDWLLKKYPEIKKVGDHSTSSEQAPLRPGIVHRLDKGTSGILLVAKNQKYFEYLKSLFQNHEIKKTYLALVAGVPKENEAVIDAPIGIKNGTTKRTVHAGKMKKPAVTHYRIIQKLEDKRGDLFSLLEIRPLTGRTHQIRVHLASIGHPVVGDRLYGSKSLRRNLKPKTQNLKPSPVRLMLHAVSLEFSLMNGKRLKIEAAPPEFEKIIGAASHTP